MAEVLTVIRAFDLFGTGDQTPYGIDTPKINAQFVGVSPAMAFDVNNQPKLSRENERQLRQIEDSIRTEFRESLSNLGGDDLAANLTIFHQLITTFKTRIDQDLLVADQLELESLTTSGEWLSFWQDNAPLVQAKSQQQQTMPKDF